jgi:uncharacterized membrane protein
MAAAARIWKVVLFTTRVFMERQVVRRYEDMSEPGNGQPLGRRLRRHFVTGLMIVVPMAVTLWVALWLFRFLDNVLGAMLRPLLPYPIPGAGLLLLILVILAVGWFARSESGASLILWLDRRLSRIPLASWIYGTASQITHSTLENRRGTFKRCVLVQYPKRDSWVLGFVTGVAPQVARDRLHEQDLVTVYVPTTPNPTSGFLLFVPERDTIDAGIPPELGFKVVISAGSVSIDRADRKGARQALAELLSRL